MGMWRKAALRSRFIMTASLPACATKHIASLRLSYAIVPYCFGVPSLTDEPCGDERSKMTCQPVCTPFANFGTKPIGEQNELLGREGISFILPFSTSFRIESEMVW